MFELLLNILSVGSMAGLWSVTCCQGPKVSKHLVKFSLDSYSIYKNGHPIWAPHAQYMIWGNTPQEWESLYAKFGPGQQSYGVAVDKMSTLALTLPSLRDSPCEEQSRHHFGLDRSNKSASKPSRHSLYKLRCFKLCHFPFNTLQIK